MRDVEADEGDESLKDGGRGGKEKGWEGEEARLRLATCELFLLDRRGTGAEVPLLSSVLHLSSSSVAFRIRKGVAGVAVMTRHGFASLHTAAGTQYPIW